MHAFREGGRSQPRILYLFRTPPNVRVGRAALDEEAIREIESHNPDLTFDWTRILKSQAPPATTGPPPEDERRRRGGARGGRPSARPAGEARREAPAREGPVAQPWGRTDLDRVDDEPPRPMPMADTPAPALAEGGAAEPRGGLPPGLHVTERIGVEGYRRLQGRYAELMARITERVTDPGKLEQLRAAAERLNPETWITDEEAQAGLEGFEAGCQAVRNRLGRRRRRSRRGGARRRRPERSGPETPAVGTATDRAPSDESETD